MSLLALNVISEREDKSFIPNHIHLELKGKNVNNVIVNTIRRTILEEIPTYAFDLEKISIKSNTSVYNNDYLRNRIENFPIQNVENLFDLDEYEKIRGSIINNEYIEEENVNNYDLLNLHLKKENTSDQIINVTTDDCSFYLKGKKIDSIYNNPLLICKLKKNEHIELSAVVKKSIPLEHAKYSIASLCCFEKIDDNKYILKFENRDQVKNREIITRACNIIIHRLQFFLKSISSKKFSSDSYGKIILENENHTLGNLISRSLQDNKDIIYAAYKMDHLLIKELTIEYKIENNKSINKILETSLNELINIYRDINKKI